MSISSNLPLEPAHVAPLAPPRALVEKTAELLKQVTQVEASIHPQDGLQVDLGRQAISKIEGLLQNVADIRARALQPNYVFNQADVQALHSAVESMRVLLVGGALQVQAPLAPPPVDDTHRQFIHEHAGLPADQLLAALRQEDGGVHSDDELRQQMKVGLGDVMESVIEANLGESRERLLALARSVSPGAFTHSELQEQVVGAVERLQRQVVAANLGKPEDELVAMIRGMDSGIHTEKELALLVRNTVSLELDREDPALTFQQRQVVLDNMGKPMAQILAKVRDIDGPGHTDEQLRAHIKAAVLTHVERLAMQHPDIKSDATKVYQHLLGKANDVLSPQELLAAVQTARHQPVGGRFGITAERIKALDENVFVRLMEDAAPEIRANRQIAALLPEQRKLGQQVARLEARIAVAQQEVDQLAHADTLPSTLKALGEKRLELQGLEDKLVGPRQALDDINAHIEELKQLPAEHLTSRLDAQAEELEELASAMALNGSDAAQAVCLSHELARDIARMRQEIAAAGDAVTPEQQNELADAERDLDWLQRGVKAELGRIPHLEALRDQYTAELESLAKPPSLAELQDEYQQVMSRVKVEGPPDGINPIADQLDQQRKLLDDKIAARQPERIAALQEQLQLRESQLAPLQQARQLHDKLARFDKDLARLDSLLKGADGGQMAWSGVKAAYLGGEQRLEFAMRAVFDFRKQYESVTLKDVLDEDQNKLKALSVGSIDLPSDSDVHLEGARQQFTLGGADTKLMETWNKRFGKAWGMEAGSVFDINLYTKALNPDIAAELSGKRYEWHSQEALAQHNEGQDIAALVKQRKYMSKEEWATFREEMKTSLAASTMPATEQQAVLKRYDTADRWFRMDYQDDLEKAKTQLKGTYAHLSDFDLELMASNRLYETSSRRADDYIRQFEAATRRISQLEKALENSPQKDLLAKNLAEARDQRDMHWANATRELAKAHLFANEPYFSEGPIRHVVGNEQGLKTLQVQNGRNVALPLDDEDEFGGMLEVTPEQALQSATENFGDCLKELHHHGANFQEAAMRASKYAGRICRALELSLDGAEPSAEVRQLMEMFQSTEVLLLKKRKGENVDTGPAFATLSAGGVTDVASLQANLTKLVRLGSVQARVKMAQG